jgi:15-cis-phytoene synthase
MQDEFSYCAERVRTVDRDRYLAALFAPAAQRGALFALYAFNAEIARVREAAREPLPGEIRLQWWSDALRGERAAEANANPIARALLATVERHQLASSRLIELVDARRFDLYDEPMHSLADLEAHLCKTSSALFALAARILAGIEAESVAEPGGIAYGMAALLRAFPQHAARHQLYVPVELLQRHQVQTGALFAGRSSFALNAALADLRGRARRHLAAVRQSIAALPPAALPAFLPLALVGPSLDRLDRADAFDSARIGPWRRQWLIWRAARNPGRIAG